MSGSQILPLRVLPALALCLLASGFLALSAQAEDGWWGGLSKGQNVSLGDVLATPSAYQGKTLTVTAIFHKMDKYYDPLRSGLNAQRYDNFALWPDGLSLWENDDFMKTHPFFYLPKTHRQRNELMRLQRFTRLQVTLRLRGNIRGKPAFEALSFRATGHRLGERVVRQMMDGDKRARRGDAEIAARRYKDVLASHPDLPPVYNLKVRKRLADALREMGYPEKAMRIEGGAPIQGSTPLPKTQRDPFQPNRPDATGSPDGPTRGDATGSPDGLGSPPAGDATGSPDGLGDPPRGDATGSPDGVAPRRGDATGSPDAADLGPPPSWDPPAPSRGRRMNDDALPGQPYGDLGTRRGEGRNARPRQARPGAPRPRDQQPRRGARIPQRGDQQPAVRLPAGVPPKRTPRLTGVK